MSLEIGAVYDGKVTGIMKFGAFVALPERQSGLVHISEIADCYVDDVGRFLQVGQEVRVKVLRITEDGKVNLSIKKAAEPQDAPRRETAPEHGAPHGEGEDRPVRRPQTEGEDRSARRPQPTQPRRAEAPAAGTVEGPSDNTDFEARLKKFMKESDSRIADNRLYNDHRERSRKR